MKRRLRILFFLFTYVFLLVGSSSHSHSLDLTPHSSISVSSNAMPASDSSQDEPDPTDNASVDASEIESDDALVYGFNFTLNERVASAVVLQSADPFELSLSLLQRPPRI